MKFFQRLGRAIMLPVAVLPVAAILVGLGYWVAEAVGDDTTASAFLLAAGGALLDNLPLLFAIGIAVGMAEKANGTAALAGLVSWLTITTLLDPETVQGLLSIENIDDVNPAFGAIENAFVGILCGLIGAWSYNRFKDTQLPDALSFFSGKRSVAIIAAGISLVVAGALLLLWPLAYSGLVIFGEWMLGMGALGAGLFGFFNRLLIPLGLHHALNSVFWFDIAGINDLNNFLSGDGVYGVTGTYMAGFFPIMMFGLPGAALAMYVTAKTQRRKVAAGILISASVASFLTGVTEPLEFAFLFLAPGLFVIHALFTGLSMFVTALLPTQMGFGFSAGFIDLLLGWTNPMAQNPWMLPLLGLGWFLVYFLIFTFIIKRFDLKTPGREDDEDATLDEATEDKYARIATDFLDGLGGAANIRDLDNCMTRLRMEISDPSIINERQLKNAGAAGVVKAGGHSVQVVYGLNVQFVADAMERIMSNPERAHGTTRDASPQVNTEHRSGERTLTAEPVTLQFQQPVAGRVLPLSATPDPAFAQGTLGPGVAIDPTGDTVTAPADGTVASIFPTHHAIGLRLHDGTEVLIHVGIDTVSLKGSGFTTLVAEGDDVVTGAPLLRFDRTTIESAGYSPITPVVILNNPSARISFNRH